MLGRKTIWLHGWWVRNLGDDLMLRTLLQQLGSRRVRVMLLTERKNSAYYKAMGVKTICPDSWLYKKARKLTERRGLPVPYYLLPGKRSLFVILGGSLFIDDKTEKSERIKYTRLTTAVRRAGSAYVIGSNFGPIRQESFRDQYRELFRQCADVCFRDRHSYDLFADSLTNVRYAGDIVLEMRRPAFERKENTVAMAPIDCSGRPELKEFTQRYEETMRSLIAMHLERGDRVTLVSFCSCQGDTAVCRRLRSAFPKEQRRNVKIVADTDPDEKLRALMSARKIYATRFHAMILGVIAGAELIPVIYNEKTENALKTYADSYVSFPIDEMDEGSADRMFALRQVITARQVGASQFEALLNALDGK